MKEKVKVKVLRSSKFIEELEFTNYDKALDYAMQKVEIGYSCLLLRLVGERHWVKMWMHPPETM